MSTEPIPATLPAPAEGTPPSPAKPPVQRLASLDIFRGLTIAFMILVNNPGSWSAIYAPLRHADWHGWTPTDLVFPFFLFIVGVATPFSLSKRVAESGRGVLFLHIVIRALSLFLLGALGYAIPAGARPAPVPDGFGYLTVLRVVSYCFIAAGFVLLLYPWKSTRRSLLIPPVVGLAFFGLLAAIHFANKHALANGLPNDFVFGDGLLTPWRFRIPGVLQRIAVCYLLAASLAMVLGWRLLSLLTLSLLVGYSWLLLAGQFPNHTPGSLTLDDNLAYRIDAAVLRTHVYSFYDAARTLPRGDPEGLLSTLGALVTTLLGILAGLWLRSSRPNLDKAAGMLAFGVVASVLGVLLGWWLLPINKPIWTPSYVVFAAGMALLTLGAVYYFADVHGYRRWGLPFTAYGTNAITVFVLAGILGRLSLLISWTDGTTGKPIALKTYLARLIDTSLQSFPNVYSPHNASLAYALAYVLFFLIVALVLYRLKIFLKV